MTQNDSLSLLVQAVQLAQKRGAFKLQEAKLIQEAVEVFVPQGTNENVGNTETAEEEENLATEDNNPFEAPAKEVATTEETQEEASETNATETTPITEKG